MAVLVIKLATQFKFDQNRFLIWFSKHFFLSHEPFANSVLKNPCIRDSAEGNYVALLLALQNK